MTNLCSGAPLASGSFAQFASGEGSANRARVRSERRFKNAGAVWRDIQKATGTCPSTHRLHRAGTSAAITLAGVGPRELIEAHSIAAGHHKLQLLDPKLI